MMATRGLYVEIDVMADIERVWHLTQDPGLHPQWDLRFSRIVPLGELDHGGYRFRYERRLPGHTITGSGTALGEKVRDDGTRTSALRFDTSDRLSPLRDGRGYWRYVPIDGGVRFITGYDYVPGFGRAVDRILRPLVLWMTAWSFDRLRIWAEADVAIDDHPASAWSIFAFWRKDRPRASRCRTASPSRDVFDAAPRALDGLEAP